MNLYWTREELKKWSFFIFIGTVLVYSARSALPVVSVLVRDEFGWDNNELGKVMGSFSYGYMMSQIIGGFLADKFGGAIVMTYCGVIWSILTYLTPTLVRHSTSPLKCMMIKRIFLGVSQGLHYPSFTSLIGEKVRDGERSLPYAFIASGGQIGLLLVGSAGSWIGRTYKWDLLFELIGLLSFLWIIILYKMNREYNSSYKYNFPASSKDQEVTARPALCKKPIVAMLVAHMAANNCFFILFNWLPAYFHTKYPDASASIYSSVPWSLTLFGSIGSGYICDTLGSKYNMTFGRKLVASVALGASAISLFFLSHCETFELSLFHATMVCFFHSFNAGSILINPSDLYPQSSGFVFGIMNTAGAIPGFVGVQAVGYALHHDVSWSNIWQIVAGINLLGNVIYLLAGSGRRLA